MSLPCRIELNVSPTVESAVLHCFSFSGDSQKLVFWIFPGLIDRFHVVNPVPGNRPDLSSGAGTVVRAQQRWRGHPLHTASSGRLIGLAEGSTESLPRPIGGVRDDFEPGLSCRVRT
eukprot:s680_g18.t1